MGVNTNPVREQCRNIVHAIPALKLPWAASSSMIRLPRARYSRGLYTVVRGDAALIAVQVLDGVANVIFGVASVLVCSRPHARARALQSGLRELWQGLLA